MKETQTSENELLESQRFLSTLISNLPGYVYRCHEEDKQWCTQFASDGIYELTGYHANDFLRGGKMAYGELVLQEDREMVQKSVNASIKQKRPYQIIYRIKTADGKIKWVWEQGRGVFSINGTLLATEGFITDITEKKLAEQELIKKNEELSALNLIGKALSKLANPSEITETIASELVKLFNNQNIYIALIDEKKNMIFFPFYMIEGVEEEHPPRIFGNGLTEYIITSKMPLLIKSDVENIFSELGIQLIGKKCKSLLGVPVLAGSRVIGVITLQDYKNESSFDVSHLEMLMTIASQAATAFENYRLYNEIQQELITKKQAEEQIKKSLREKEVLLQEVHHRVKNNLQIMSSLLKLQSKYITDKKILEMFRESEGRIKSMTIVHSKLYSTGDYERIDFRDYVKSLTDNFATTYGIRGRHIKIEIDIGKIPLNIDTAVPCGLIINELISNSVKHAFPDGRNGKIIISLKPGYGRSYILTVNDNGIGLPPNFSINNINTLGIQLVSLLTGQLQGKLNIKAEGGTEFNITFEEAQYKPRE